MPPSPDLATLMPADRRRWATYVELHDTGRRKEALAELEALTASVAAYDPEQRAAFTDALCAAWVDPLVPPDTPPDKLRYPLVRDVLVPSLRARLGAPAQARRLAVLLSRRALAPAESQRLPGAFALLVRAVEADREDRRAREWLLHLLLEGLDYVFHELPSGVLAEPDELEDDARRIERLAADLGRQAALAPIVAFTREQAAAWGDYRTRDPRTTSYERVMRERGVDWEDPPEPGTPIRT